MDFQVEQYKFANKMIELRGNLAPIQIKLDAVLGNLYYIPD